MNNKRLLELAGMTEAAERVVVYVKHKNEPKVAITPRNGVTKERAMEVKKLLMTLKKEGMKFGKPSDAVEITVETIGSIKESSADEEDRFDKAMEDVSDAIFTAWEIAKKVDIEHEEFAHTLEKYTKWALSELED